MLVVVTAIVSGYKGDGMQLNMHITDATGNEYGKPKDIAGEQRTVFTSHADAPFDVCFENVLTGCVFLPDGFLDGSVPTQANIRQRATSSAHSETSSWISILAPMPRTGRPSRRPRS
jgi:hypothetical protein